MINKKKLVHELTNKLVTSSLNINVAQEGSIEAIRENERVAVYSEILELIDQEDYQVKEVSRVATTAMLEEIDMNAAYYSQIMGKTIALVLKEETKKRNRAKDEKINGFIRKGNPADAIDLILSD